MAKALYFSCPAVSHISNLIDWLKSFKKTVFVVKEAPGVAVNTELKVFDIYLFIILVFPTPLSPITVFYLFVSLTNCSPSKKKFYDFKKIA